MTDLLAIQQLTKTLNDTPLLKGVDLTLAPGEVLGLVGENGVGKSTLMGILAGDTQATGGTICLFGAPFNARTRGESLSRGVSIVRQRWEVDPLMTVAQSIYREKLPGIEHSDQLATHAQKLLADLELDIDARALMGDLTPSARNLAEVARVVAESAHLVILDEVGATFTPQEIRSLHQAVRRLTSQGRGIIYISHHLHELQMVCDRVAVLTDGQISDEFDAKYVTADYIADAMLTKSYSDQRSRSGHVKDDVMLSVESLNVPNKVKNMTFDVYRGEVVGLVGSRRSGVQEVAEVLAGLTDGKIDEVRVDGTSHTVQSADEAAQLGIGYFSDDHDKLDLEDDELSMSGGQQQKAALNRWMQNGHKVIILNHPCRGIDVGARREIYNLVAEHTANGRSALLITTDTTELLEWCDRIAIVRNGKIKEIKPARDFDDEQLVRAMSRRAF